MTNTIQPIQIEKLTKVLGGQTTGGDGDSLARHDVRFPPLEDKLKGKTKGAG